MQFGSRKIEVGEPVLYFEDVSIATLQERSKLVLARGGWENQPRVTWEERSEVEFRLLDGVMSQLSFSVLLDSVLTTPEKDEPLLVPLKEGPTELKVYHDEATDKNYYGIYLTQNPILYPTKKVFIFEYTRGREQKKVYGELWHPKDKLDNSRTLNFIALHDENGKPLEANTDKEYVVDYYYEYGDEALIYTISKERFNGLFSLEGKFYAKDENEGLNYTNLIYMPKVRIVSDISLRLGERADPVVSAFNIIGLPETLGKNSTIVEITRLGTDIDGNI